MFILSWGSRIVSNHKEINSTLISLLPDNFELGYNTPKFLVVIVYPNIAIGQPINYVNYLTGDQTTVT